MSKPAMKGYPAEFKERAVKLAVESEQPIAQTARDLGVNENTLHTWRPRSWDRPLASHEARSKMSDSPLIEVET